MDLGGRAVALVAVVVVMILRIMMEEEDRRKAGATSGGPGGLGSGGLYGRGVDEGSSRPWRLLESRTGRTDHSRVPGVCGCIRGSSQAQGRRVAVVAPDLRFYDVFVGFPGAAHDQHVFGESPLGKALREGAHPFCWQAPIPYRDTFVTPYLLGRLLLQADTDDHHALQRQRRGCRWDWPYSPVQFQP